MCEEFYDEFNKLRRQLTEDDKQYLNKANIAIIQHAYPGRKYSKWKQTNKAIFYKYQNDKYRNYKSIKVYGLCEVYNECIGTENTMELYDVIYE